MSYETDIEDDLYPSEKARERNARKPFDPERHDEMPCFLCHSPVRKGMSQWLVVTHGGCVFVPDERFTDANDAGFMGAHPLGPTCWRKIKKAFRQQHGEDLEAVRERGPTEAA